MPITFPHLAKSAHWTWQWLYQWHTWSATGLFKWAFTHGEHSGSFSLLAALPIVTPGVFHVHFEIEDGEQKHCHLQRPVLPQWKHTALLLVEGLAACCWDEKALTNYMWLWRESLSCMEIFCLCWYSDETEDELDIIHIFPGPLVCCGLDMCMSLTAASVWAGTDNACCSCFVWFSNRICSHASSYSIGTVQCSNPVSDTSCLLLFSANVFLFG